MAPICLRLLSPSPSLFPSGQPKFKSNSTLIGGRGSRPLEILGSINQLSSLRSTGTISVVSKASTNFSGSSSSGFDVDQDLKDKANTVRKHLKGRNVNLFGLMGAGKTTLGRSLAELLDFTFVDSDEYVELLLGKSVAEIFEKHGESYFRYFEGEALRKLSSVPKQVVSTGGGAVINRSNWKYMKRGVSIFLDVPIQTLASRIERDDGRQRPLLEHGSVFRKLLLLYKGRKAAYASIADVTVSLLGISENLGVDDVSYISTTAIALEVLTAIESFLQAQNNKSLHFHMFPEH